MTTLIRQHDHNLFRNDDFSEIIVLAKFANFLIDRKHRDIYFKKIAKCRQNEF